MIESIDSIRIFYPPSISQNKAFDAMLLKEYVQCQALEFLSRQTEASEMTFIGGTCLRLVHGINRFSEDLDFDCKNLTQDRFMQLTDRLVAFLHQCGYRAEAKEQESARITAFRRSIYFPELLFNMKLSGYREQRFLLKIETQDQGVDYAPETVFLNRCGFLFPLKAAPLSVLCAMKVTAVLHRGKGRDFYDLMFLLQRTAPDYQFLSKKVGITDKAQLTDALLGAAASTNLPQKCRDFEHLLIDRADAQRVLHFSELVQGL